MKFHAHAVIEWPYFLDILHESIALSCSCAMEQPPINDCIEQSFVIANFFR